MRLDVALLTIVTDLFYSVGLAFTLYIFQSVLGAFLYERIDRKYVLEVFAGALLFSVLHNYAANSLIRWQINRYRYDLDRSVYTGSLKSLGVAMTGLAIIGAIGWFWLIVSGIRNREETRRALEPLRVTKYQIWLQDIFIGSLMLGLSLTVLQFRITLPRQSVANFAAMWGAYRVFVMVASFMFIVDVCRYSKTAQSAKPRALFVAGTMLLCAWYIWLFMAIVTWLVWRRWLIAPGVEPAEAVEDETAI